MATATRSYRVCRRSRMVSIQAPRPAGWYVPPPDWLGCRRFYVNGDSTMETRRLGQSSLEVPPITFGCNVFGWTVDEETSFALLDAWLDAGFNFLDTADVYSSWHPGNRGGESEVIIGNWLKARGNRDKVILATKLGVEMAPGKKGLSRGYMQTAVEDSLRRLQTDYIDLYQSHRDDPDTPIEETLSSYGELIKQGKVREIGASNF